MGVNHGAAVELENIYEEVDAQVLVLTSAKQYNTTIHNCLLVRFEKCSILEQSSVPSCFPDDDTGEARM